MNLNLYIYIYTCIYTYMNMIVSENWVYHTNSLFKL